MDILINVVLPLSLAIIMLSLGIGLTFADFGRVLRTPKAFAIGAIAQILLLPVVTYGIVLGFGLGPEIAVGFMLLSFCPGGVTSNMIARLSKGDVALSVSLTAVVSLLSILTVPILAAWSVVHFMGDAAPDVSVTGLAISVFIIVTLPVLIGVLIRRFASGFAIRIEPFLSRLATLLFIIIVVAALAANWDVFIGNLGTLGPALIVLNAALLIIGLGLALALALPWDQAKTISVETGIQNATLGITLAALISGQSEGFSAMALPSGVYGILMYIVAAPFVAWFRSR
ncbi:MULTISPECIES: bile acid:sodium symporter family protein [Roseobacteraceae]|uniref:bile acid:sodium symporter family protein n=1 Tax=Roseobacteraceae TaxID=2854170 RepID=UPI001C486F51|nr:MULTISPECIES: bile acid:sodium symporter family protein [Roseobacteraceae]MBV7408956.1 bile acid:sodium symporter family protein [Maritimibacter sp. DP1N21-5]MBY5934357.1 bile acid:sodium symporter family protein [Tateyamaria omphalii]